jgi:transposase InsO family protein
MTRKENLYDLNDEQEAIMKKIYYDDKFTFGRDKIFYKIKSEFPDSGISKRAVMFWLKTQEVYQKNQRAPRDVATKRFVNSKKGYIQVDLIDMSMNAEKGFNWILTAVDVYSKFAVALPLKFKKQESVKRVMAKLFDIYDDISVIQTDQGQEFMLGDFYQQKGVRHLMSKAYTPSSQGVVERFNGTLKTMLKKAQEIDNTRLWIKMLPKLVNNYNSSLHSITQRSPDVIENMDKEAIQNIENSHRISPLERQMNFYESIIKVGTKVRVKLKKSAFDKKSSDNYTEDIYEVFQVIIPRKKFNRRRYKLKDSDGDLIEGNYNVSQLMIVSYPKDIRLK